MGILYDLSKTLFPVYCYLSPFHLVFWPYRPLLRDLNSYCSFPPCGLHMPFLLQGTTFWSYSYEWFLFVFQVFALQRGFFWPLILDHLPLSSSVTVPFNISFIALSTISSSAFTLPTDSFIVHFHHYLPRVHEGRNFTLFTITHLLPFIVPEIYGYPIHICCVDENGNLLPRLVLRAKLMKHI